MNIKELEQRLNQLLQEAKPLAIKSRDGDLTDEESKRFDELVEQINTVGEDLTEARNRAAQGEKVLGTLDEYRKATGSAARSLPGAGAETRQQNPERRDFRNPGKRFVRSEAFKRFQASPFGTSGREMLGSTYFADDGEDVEVDYRDGQGPIDFRDLVYTGSFGASYMQPNRLPGIVAGQAFPLRVRDVLTNGRTDSATVQFVRKGATTNNAAEVAEATTVAGATAKPESAVDLEVVETTVKTIAHWIPVTRQMLQDAAQIKTFIDAELLLGLEKREDTQLVAGDGSGANLRGILNTSGIQVLDATYFTTTAPLPANANELDRIRRAVRKIRVTGEANPNFVLAHPDDVEVWDTLKDADGNYLLRSGGPDAGGVRSIWGLTIVESLAVTARRPLVGDGRYGIVLDKMDGEIFMTDSHSDWFVKNLYAILAESRLALAVTLPAAFADVTLPAA